MVTAQRKPNMQNAGATRRFSFLNAAKAVVILGLLCNEQGV